MDLEEQRVCEFNMHMNLEYYNNPVSLVHNRRHLDDITYNYSPSKITVSVLTDDREKYKVWSQWLEYLDEEIMYANTHYLIGENSDFFRNYKLPEVIKCVKPSENAKLEDLKKGTKVYPLELIPYILEPGKEIVHFVSKQI